MIVPKTIKNTKIRATSHQRVTRENARTRVNAITRPTTTIRRQQHRTDDWPIDLCPSTLATANPKQKLVDRLAREDNKNRANVVIVIVKDQRQALTLDRDPVADRRDQDVNVRLVRVRLRPRAEVASKEPNAETIDRVVVLRRVRDHRDLVINAIVRNPRVQVANNVIRIIIIIKNATRHDRDPKNVREDRDLGIIITNDLRIINAITIVIGIKNRHIDVKTKTYTRVTFLYSSFKFFFFLFCIYGKSFFFFFFTNSALYIKCFSFISTI